MTSGVVESVVSNVIGISRGVREKPQMDDTTIKRLSAVQHRSVKSQNKPENHKNKYKVIFAVVH